MAFHHPTRAGTRGGQGLFKWDDVKDDKHRENYLGHSLNAPVGRWQKNKDLTWYAKDESGTLTATETLDAELKLIRQQEQEALAEALGYTSGAKRTGGVTKSEIQRLVKLDFEGADGAGGMDDGGEAGLGYKSVKERTALADGVSAQAVDGPYRDEDGGEWVAAAPPQISTAPDNNASSSFARDDRRSKKEKKEKKDKKDKKARKEKKEEKSEMKRRRREEGAGSDRDERADSVDERQRRRSRMDRSRSPAPRRRDFSPTRSSRRRSPSPSKDTWEGRDGRGYRSRSPAHARERRRSPSESPERPPARRRRDSPLYDRRRSRSPAARR
ncbi:kinase phosphorylation protein-domain-containing protein [Geranomyces variabilis]|nr:kinase phosphorylation protein-domain-containing protein [Geranomyces variabilis]KAJ3138269.1 hypothetical protein HDU90_001231 [Geranomyces variabilis]